mmetsp:Transcript_16831/g.36201  ORF Transcript_16831/g.36201 Transcript_16831/m.36201 type:complete len:342 (-) Transcript_16831:366-1391(-)|eukprot:CAMPEP_0206446260 /NCGR_PEP_ID=MMETSP0324_2-20121206/16028_1 /ASSEMBLY_ACC=CAM_ASM_000836 /TAXON_ID=2866 /ORGANISM="Crypthecodinium cohnii, Strain Seligo" /LENGTH=341 /DNA_ID=CAMNT_0053914693 /DNA_START=95 /DNA_END=1120 /DNA_ORIENTATION=-
MVQKLLIWSLFFASSAASASASQEDQELPTWCHHAAADLKLEVEAQVFSGTENPILSLTEDSSHKLCSLMAAARTLKPVPTCRVLGFVGWKICPTGSTGNGQSCAQVRGEPGVDQFLLRQLQMSPKETRVSQEVLSHIEQELHRLHHGGDLRCKHQPASIIPDVNCSATIVGPDDPTKVKYDPQHDDSGCFVKEQDNNNCYDYANDIVTNTFAQPGRGSGVCPPHTRPCVPNTCEDVKKAAVSDGLTWVGTELPSSLPAHGHYVSLHIWPKTNFHWLRMDGDKMWSHKPGGSAVRNVDNDGKTIHDPAKADVSPWSQHCGYMLAVPSKSNIKFFQSESIIV